MSLTLIKSNKTDIPICYIQTKNKNGDIIKSNVYIDYDTPKDFQKIKKIVLDDDRIIKPLPYIETGQRAAYYISGTSGSGK